MAKRIKSQSIFDELDYEILTYLKDNGEQIMDIQKQIKVSHRSLKPHLDKLIINKFLKWEFNCLIISKRGSLLLSLLDLTKPKNVDWRKNDK